MTLIRACTLQDMAGLLALYRELRPHDPVLAPDAAHTALTTLLAQPHPTFTCWWRRWMASWRPPASSVW